jgi:hypothetical protein
MSLNNRYLPSHPQGQSCLYALDFANILPPGVGLTNASLEIQLNTVPPTPTTDFTQDPITVDARRLYCRLTGGVSARDYRLNWSGEDTLGNIWARSCLLLCSATS